MKCRNLAVGEESILLSSPNYSPGGSSLYYRLKRTGEKSYTAYVNPVFTDGRSHATDPALPLHDPNLDALYKQRLSKCYRAAAPALLGPAGETLTIELEDFKGRREAPEVNVQIVDGGLRGHESRFDENFACSTMLHETLHWLGMVDEYEEIWNRNGRHAVFDCRALGPRDSVMAYDWDAFRRVFEYDRPITRECQCVTTKCRSQLETWKKAECPKGSRESAKKELRFEDAAPGLTVEKASDDTIRITQGPVLRQGQSLLYPAHFRAIVRPGCQENKTFYQCASNAQTTRKSSNGDGCRVDPIPAACANGSDRWLFE